MSLKFHGRFHRIACVCAAGALAVAAGPAAAQTETSSEVVRMQAVTATSREAVTALENADAVPETLDEDKLFIDTEVADVLVDETMSVAIMGELPDSPCASNAYVFGRDEPKWLYQTGRLLQARKENAVIRVSFRCEGGYQYINALQFLSPPGPRTAQGVPRRSQTVTARAANRGGDNRPQQRRGLPPETIPLPSAPAPASRGG